MTTYHNWQLAIDNRIATLTLNRPKALNCLTPDTLHELRDISQMLNENRDVWAVILEAEGDHFSVGVDVKSIRGMVGQNEGAFRRNLRDLQDCLDAFEAIRQPTIGKISGYCIGGGLLLAMTCDFRIADETATFHLPELRLGIAVLMGTQRLTRVAGMANTKAMVLLAERFDAQQAMAYGILNDVVGQGELDDAVQHLAEKFLKLPPRTVSVAKRIIEEGDTLSLRKSQDLEINLQATLLNSPDFEEGVNAFFEKREAQFKGE